MPSVKIYIGNLDPDRPPREDELDDLFRKYGNLLDVWVAKKPPGFAFVTMDDLRDAEEAVKDLDGSRFMSANIRVEISRGGPKGGGKGKGGGGGFGGGRDRSRSRDRRRDDSR